MNQFTVTYNAYIRTSGRKIRERRQAGPPLQRVVEAASKSDVLEAFDRLFTPTATVRREIISIK